MGRGPDRSLVISQKASAFYLAITKNMKNKRVRKNKHKILNNLIVLITAGVIAFSPVVAIATPAQAVPELPSTPDEPETPELPDGSTSETQTEETTVNESVETSPSTTENTEPTQAEIDAAEEAAWQEARAARRAARKIAEAEAEAEAAVATVEAEPTANSSTPYVKAPETSLNDIGSPEWNGEISLADLSADNSNTGSDSDNDASSTVNNDFDFTANNDLNTTNNAYVNVDSGDNSADKNTGDGEVVTGDADIVLTALNVGNNTNVGTQVFNVYDDQTGDLIIDFDNVSSVPVGTVCYGGQSSNDTTGEDSDNNATTSCTSSNTILVDNNGNIVNDYYLSADTGGNSADKNTGDGSVTTGDVNVVLNVINFINNNFLGGSGELLLGLVNIFGNLNGNIILNIPDSGDDYFLGGGGSAGNSNTGTDSNNNALVDNNTDTNIAMINNSNILNNVMLFGDTGGNDTSKNTGSGNITTGDVNSSLNVTNVSNMNMIGDGGTLWMVLINNLGDWSGQIWGLDGTGAASPFFTFAIGDDGAFNAVTGADSHNNATVNNNNDTDITMVNNANLTNNVYINTNTGGNSASMNTGSGSINTGDINIAANIVNILNNNFLAGRFVLTIVNVFGSWTGDIFSSGTGGPEKAIVTDENSTLTFAANSNKPTYAIPNYSGTPIPTNLYATAGGVDQSGESSVEIIPNLAKVSENIKINSVTKVIGRDSASILDYWWVIIPLLIAISSVLYRRRFL